MASKLNTVNVTFDGDIAVLHMCNGENRFDIDFLDVLEAALDEVLSNDNVVALVTVGEGKFYSNGVNLDWILKTDPFDFLRFWVRLQVFLAKILTFPMVTVAAVNGHAFAGGMLMAMAHDYRVQNSHRGYMSMNEVFIKKGRFPRFLLELLRLKVPNAAWLQTIGYGRRYTGSDAKAANLVDDVASDSSTTVQRAVELARQMASKGPFDRQAVTNLKQDLYQRALEHCYLFANENYITPWKSIISNL